MKKEEANFPSRSIRFPRPLYNEINAFAKANGLQFASAVKLLLTNALKDPKITKTYKQVED